MDAFDNFDKWVLRATKTTAALAGAIGVAFAVGGLALLVAIIRWIWLHS